MMKKTLLLLLGGVLFASSVLAQESKPGQWSLALTRTFVEGDRSDGNKQGVGVATDGTAVLYFPEFNGDIHKISVTWKKPPLYIPIGQENKITMDVVTRLDDKAYSDEAFNKAIGLANLSATERALVQLNGVRREFHPTSLGILIAPEMKLGKKTVGFSYWKHLFDTNNNPQKIEEIVDKMVDESGATEQQRENWEESMKMLKFRRDDSDRLTCDETYTPLTALGDEAFMIISMSTGFYSRNAGFPSSNKCAVNHIYLYKITHGTGYWRKVGMGTVKPRKVIEMNHQDGNVIQTLLFPEEGRSIFRYTCLDGRGGKKHNCKDESLETGIAYTLPLDYYAPGDAVQTTYCTNTEHTEPFCSPHFQFPIAQAYLRTPVREEVLAYLENSLGKHLFQALRDHITTEKPGLLSTEKEEELNISDIQERACTTMPGHEVGDTVLLVYEISNNQQGLKHAYCYTYVWQEGEMPANPNTFADLEKKTTWFDPSKKDDDDDDTDGGSSFPIQWIWIPLGLGGVLVSVKGGGLLISKIKGLVPKKGTPQLINPNKKDRTYYQNLYNTEDVKAINNIQLRRQMNDQIISDTWNFIGDKHNTNVKVAVTLDKSGDVSIVILNQVGASKLSKGLSLSKTFLKGTAEDLAKGKNIGQTVYINALKTANEVAIDGLTGDKAGYLKKVFMGTLKDTTNSVVTQLDNSSYKSMDDNEFIKEVGKDLNKSLILNSLTNINVGKFTQSELENMGVPLNQAKKVGEIANDVNSTFWNFMSDDNVVEVINDGK